MDNLIASIHNDGINIIKNELYEKIKKFTLVDENSEEYYTNDIHSVYFDENGILTATVIIPKIDDFKVFNKYVYLKTLDDLIVCVVETAPIQFLKGIGGVQEIKITVSGEPSSVIFKNNEYFTADEFEQYKQNFVNSFLSNFYKKQETNEKFEKVDSTILRESDIGKKVSGLVGSGTKLLFGGM